MPPPDDVSAALQGLAEVGQWHGQARGDAELVRIEIRRAARRAGIRVRTFSDATGRPWAVTPDGLPAHEPWRGAAVHADQSGATAALVVDAMDRLARRSQGEPE